MRAWQIAENVWKWLREDRRLFEILTLLSVTLILAFFIPQTPVSSTDSVLFSRWLAEQRMALGQWARILESLGLFSLYTSLWMRFLLMALALVLAVRVINIVETWSHLQVARRWLQVIACLGGVFLIVGWGLQVRLGWVESNIIAWPGQSITIANRSLILSPLDKPFRLWNGRFGLYLLPSGQITGLEIQALDSKGEVLPVSLSSRSAPQPKLFIALTEMQSEAYFALPEMGYVFRVGQVSQDDAESVLVQIYRSASAELLVEGHLSLGENTVAIEDVNLHVQRWALARFNAVYNPGAPLWIIGFLMLVIGALQKTMIPQQDEPDVDVLKSKID